MSPLQEDCLVLLQSRFTFNRLQQGPDESFDEFAAQVISVGKTCGYGEHEDQLIRDRFLAGILNGQTVLSKLLDSQEVELNLERALGLAKIARDEILKNITYGAKVAILLEMLNHKRAMVDEDIMWKRVLGFANKNGTMIESIEHLKKIVGIWRKEAQEKGQVSGADSADTLIWDFYKVEEEEDVHMEEDSFYDEVKNELEIEIDEDVKVGIIKELEQQRDVYISGSVKDKTVLWQTCLQTAQSHGAQLQKVGQLKAAFESWKSQAFAVQHSEDVKPTRVDKLIWDLCVDEELELEPEIYTRDDLDESDSGSEDPDDYTNTEAKEEDVYEKDSRLVKRRAKKSPPLTLALKVKRQIMDILEVNYEEMMSQPTKNTPLWVNAQKKWRKAYKIAKQHGQPGSVPNLTRFRKWIRTQRDAAFKIIESKKVMTENEHMFINIHKKHKVMMSKKKPGERYIPPEEDQVLNSKRESRQKNEEEDVIPFPLTKEEEDEDEDNNDDDEDYVDDDSFKSENDEEEMKTGQRTRKCPTLRLSYEVMKEIITYIDANYDLMYGRPNLYSDDFEKAKACWNWVYNIAKANGPTGSVDCFARFRRWVRMQRDAAFKAIKAGRQQDLSKEDRLFFGIYEKYHGLNQNSDNNKKDCFLYKKRPRNDKLQRAKHQATYEAKMAILQERQRLDEMITSGNKAQYAAAMKEVNDVALANNVIYEQISGLNHLLRTWKSMTQKKILNKQELSPADELIVEIYKLPLDQRIQCPLCPEVFLTDNLLERHKKYCHKEELNIVLPTKRVRKSYPKDANKVKSEYPMPPPIPPKEEFVRYCPECDLEFESITDLKKHKADVHGVNPTASFALDKCAYCKQPHAPKIMMRLHVVQTHQSKPFPCDHCDETFYTDQEYESHCESQHGMKATPLPENNICPFCHNKYEGLGWHILYKHVETKNFLCHKCTYRHATKRGLDAHVRSQHPSQKDIKMCHLCDYKTSVGQNLKAHIEVKHEGKLNYQCSICSVKFYTNRRLEVHVQATHMGIKTHSCKECDAKFLYNSALNRHITTVHRNQEIGYVCEICSARYKQAKSLSRHRKTVHGIDPRHQPRNRRQIFDRDGNVLEPND